MTSTIRISLFLKLVIEIVIVIVLSMLQMFSRNAYAFINSYTLSPRYQYQYQYQYQYWYSRRNTFTSKCTQRSYAHVDKHSFHNESIMMSQQKPSPLSFTYQLGTSLYIPLTSKCNSKTLPQTRGGKKFLKTLPKDVLCSLILVRVMEQYMERLIHDHDHDQDQDQYQDQDHDHQKRKQDHWTQFISMMTIMSHQQHWDKILSSESTLSQFVIMKKDIHRIIASWLEEVEVVVEEEKDIHHSRNVYKDNKDNDYYNDKEMIQQIQNVITSFIINLNHYNNDNDYNNMQHVQQLEDNVENDYKYLDDMDVLLFHEIQLALLQNNNHYHHRQHPHPQQEQSLPPPSPIQSIVFAGEGEPTLQIEKIISLSKLIKSMNKNITIRVLTNGLLYYNHYNSTSTSTSTSKQLNDYNQPKQILQNMKDSGVDSLTIAFPTSCSKQYIKLMKPLEPNIELMNLRNIHSTSCDTNDTNDYITSNMAQNNYYNDSTISAHESVCQFIKHSLNVGFDVEVTGVVQEFVDQKETESMAISLGVHQPFRWRTCVT
jgi:hypothetical protein